MAANDSLILAEDDAPFSRVIPNRPGLRSARPPGPDGHLVAAGHESAAAIETPLLSFQRPQPGAAPSWAARSPHRQGR